VTAARGEETTVENRLTVIEDQAIMPQTFEGMMKQAEVLVRSGLLPVEIKTAAAAVAIMLTGRELGIPPMQAFRSIYVVKGKPTLSAQLMGALIFRAGHSYSILESTNDRCTIEYKRKTGEIYRHTFTIDDAQRAGLVGSPTWKQYPKAMLFSRCMSAGARAFMPDVIAGMYTPEEMAGPAVVDPETGEVLASDEQREEPIDDEWREAAPPATAPLQKAEPSKPKPVRPYEPEIVRQGVQAIAADGAKVKADEGYRGLCVGVIDGLFANDDKNMRAAKRHTLSTYLLGKGSSTEWTAGEVMALLKWACNGGDASNVNENAPIEAERIVRQYEAEHGQQALGV